MATQFLTAQQRAQLDNFPETMTQDALIKYFTLTDSDLEKIPRRSPAYSRLGFSIMLCGLRYLGFIPDNLLGLPEPALNFLKLQLGIDEAADIDLACYGQNRGQTKTDHSRLIIEYLEFNKISNKQLVEFKSWLLERAMEHDRPTTLLKEIIAKFKSIKLLRPTLVSLERLVGSVRDQAMQKTYQLVQPIISRQRMEWLDSFLDFDKDKKATILTWLKCRASSPSPNMIKVNLEKLLFLQIAKVDTWNLGELINSNRIKILSRLEKCATAQSLKRSTNEKRYPILIAFAYQSLIELLDEAVELFDQCISQAYSRAKEKLKKDHERARETTNHKVRLLDQIGSMILDHTIANKQLRKKVFSQIPIEELQTEVDECKSLSRPQNDQAIDYFGRKFGYLRQFTPQWLERLQFVSLQNDQSLIRGINIIRKINSNDNRKIPSNAPISFINDSWKRYVLADGYIDRHYYELCCLWTLRNTLRTGDIWVLGSRRYNNPDSYLISKLKWPELRT